MKDSVTISTLELFQMFPDQESARTYLESRIWPTGAVCPVCKCADRITTRKDGFYRCNHCKEDFTVRTGTIFERSHVPLHKWLYSMYLLVTARKGISSMQLSKEISITQKSAWFVLQRLREACGSDFEALRGIVEIDESYFGGKEKNKHKSKRKSGTGGVGKTAVIGMRERNGRVVAKPIRGTDKATIQAEIRAHVAEGATLHADEHSAYDGLTDTFGHETVCHKKEEYVRGDVTTNGIESVWAVLKRGLHGVYHHASDKHLHRYVNEFAFRLNDGNVGRHTLDRLNSFVDAMVGKRLTWKDLIAEPETV